MPDRPIRVERRRSVRRRRITALVAILVLSAAAVFLVFANSRDAIHNPRNLIVNNHGVKQREFVIKSAAVGRSMPVAVLLPPGYDKSDRRPVVVFLHGRGSKPDHLSSQVAEQSLAAAGPNAPILVFPYGGEASYWHDRADGAWGRYVIREVIPQALARYGGDRRRMAIAGISMGGFGAFDLARLHPGMFCAIAGHSPAIWQTGAETAAGAFDDAADFSQNDVIAVARTNPSAFGGARIWLDAGSSDPFQPGDQAMVAALRAAGDPVEAKTWPGGHDIYYWKRHFHAYVRFYAHALAHCR